MLELVRERGRAAWVIAAAWGLVAACGGRSVEHNVTDDTPHSGGRAGEGTTAGTGGSSDAAGGSGAAAGSIGVAGSSGTAGSAMSGGGGLAAGTGGGNRGGSGGSTPAVGGGKGGDFSLGKGSAAVMRACSDFCQALPASCPMAGTDGCPWDCIHAGNDSPSCIEAFASYMNRLAGHLDPTASCDESCGGSEGCAGEAIAACEAERVTWETCFEQCGTKTRDYEPPSNGCRRDSACDAYATECVQNADYTAWDCKCFNFRLPDGITGVSLEFGEGDACLAAARMCQGL
jgi:hypothetical protein